MSPSSFLVVGLPVSWSENLPKEQSLVLPTEKSEHLSLLDDVFLNFIRPKKIMMILIHPDQEVNRVGKKKACLYQGNGAIVLLRICFCPAKTCMFSFYFGNISMHLAVRGKTADQMFHIFVHCSEIRNFFKAFFLLKRQLAAKGQFEFLLY